MKWGLTLSLIVKTGGLRLKVKGEVGVMVRFEVIGIYILYGAELVNIMELRLSETNTNSELQLLPPLRVTFTVEKN